MDIFFVTTFFDNLRSNGDCREYVGYCGKNGYCYVKIDGKNFLAHRLAYFLKHGNIPKGLHVLHKCDNRVCCEPEHLFVGTALDNMLDKKSKGRQARGKTHGMQRISESSIRIIRDVYFDGFVSQRKIAEIYGVSQAAIYHIIKRKNWKHIS
jgi:hypothetical protein